MNNPDFIPNSFQTPNVLIDEIMPLLTPQEWVVLSFAIRRILGWQDRIASRQANISVTQFEKSGLSRPTIIAALVELETYHLLTKIGEAGRDGQLWELSFDSGVDVDGLIARRDAQLKKSVERTSKARASKGTGKSDLLVNGTNQKRSVGLTSTGKSDLHNKDQFKDQYKDIAPAKAVATSEAVKPEIAFSEKENQIGTPQSEKKPQPSKSALEKNPPSAAQPPLTKTVQPHIALIDAWLAALPAKPIGNQYNRNVRVASEMHKAGITPQQITDYVTELYTDAFWQKQTVSMEHIAKNIPQWLSKRKPSQPDYVPHPDMPSVMITRAKYNALMKARSA